MSRLRIAWLTPWNAESAIARSASEVASELQRRGHELTVFRTEVGDALDLPALPSTCRVERAAHWSARDIRHQFDVAVAQIGDHLGFHGALLPKLPDLDAVGVFHDAFLADLAYCWLDGDEAALRELTARTYGADAWPSGEPYLRDLADVMKRRPMLEWLARQTQAAVAHAEYYAPRLRQSCPGPVAVIPLALTYPGLPPVPPVWRGITIATVGHANANKRIDQIVMAVASSYELRSCCRIKVIGAIVEAERVRLERLAWAVGIAPLMFTGWLTDDDLPFQLRDVDVMSCLRNPVLEGASASLILAMSSKRPTLVTNHGCYAELPDDTLLKCSPVDEAVDVMRHLERLLRDASHFKALGERAHALAVRRHAPSAYTDALLPLLEEVVERRPAIDASRELRATLASFGLDAADQAVARAQDALAQLVRRRSTSFNIRHDYKPTSSNAEPGHA
ncbi:glycosyltransferase [Variovorax soli]|uniref:Glycosyltransferase involved in cell wall biosynthesis n=1 Tax=Variovorax soli TaxID=376815 RepID=A0ABU1NC92_9BURK|nr:glycosyltransferase [Variovorax soli]MDR6535963.1 glycosyltransferase involved in cell wall biosynthesis [Variovorax soli]